MWLPIFVSILLRIECFIIRPFLKLIRFRKPPPIPSIKNPLLNEGATALAKKIRNGEITSQQAVEAYIERIKEVNPFLNAVIEDRFEAAINEAKICDSKLKSGEVVPSKLEKEKPLYGVPVTIKESLALKGMLATGGNLRRKGVRAQKNGEAVQLVLDAGAIPLCVTNTPEFCCSITSSNFLYGTTVCAYDTRMCSGGSSSGEGALLGAGASPLGFGSDLVGSIRIPSLFNGIFGHKPSPDIVPGVGHFPQCEDPISARMVVLGPMARHMDDIHTAMKILSSKSSVPLRLDEPVNLQNTRVFYIKDMDAHMGLYKTKPEIQRVIEKATQHLADTCAFVEQLSPEWINKSYSFLMYFFHFGKLPNEFAENTGAADNNGVACEYLKSVFGLSENTVAFTLLQIAAQSKGMISQGEAEDLAKHKEEFCDKLLKLLGEDGVLIIPTFPRATDLPEMIFFLTDCSCYTAFANILGLPSTHVPMGLNKDGLPIGFQVIAATNQDRLCLAVAKELERKFGGWVPPS